MDYQIDGISGFESRKVVVRSPRLFSGPKLLIDDEIVKGSWGKYILRRDDGKHVMARVVAIIIDPVPQLVVDGQTYAPIPPLPWYQLVWAWMPILLVFIGGVPGVCLGVVAAFSNTRIFRSNMQPMLMKYMVVAVVSCATVLIYLVLAILMLMVFNK
jgi:hypothetical protein